MELWCGALKPQFCTPTVFLAKKKRTSKILKPCSVSRLVIYVDARGQRVQARSSCERLRRHGAKLARCIRTASRWHPQEAVATLYNENTADAESPKRTGPTEVPRCFTPPAPPLSSKHCAKKRKEKETTKKKCVKHRLSVTARPRSETQTNRMEETSFWEEGKRKRLGQPPPPPPRWRRNRQHGLLSIFFRQWSLVCAQCHPYPLPTTCRIQSKKKRQLITINYNYPRLKKYSIGMLENFRGKVFGPYFEKDDRYFFDSFRLSRRPIFSAGLKTGRSYCLFLD